MIRKCKEQITEPGKLWDQDKPTLLANMKVWGEVWGEAVQHQRQGYQRSDEL